MFGPLYCRFRLQKHTGKRDSFLAQSWVGVLPLFLEHRLTWGTQLLQQGGGLQDRRTTGGHGLNYWQYLQAVRCGCEDYNGAKSVQG